MAPLLLLCLFLATLACQRVPVDMVRVHGGPFILGTDEVDEEGQALEFGIIKPWFEDEHPAHRVILPTFDIDKHEMTNAAYTRFLDATGHRPPPHWPDGAFPPGQESVPVVNVLWDDAQAACRWADKRLPTEAEWEKAARGPDGRRHTWGDIFEEGRANIGGVKPGPTPVGQYKDGKSPYGAYDMVGNVWEWTASWYDPYPGNTFQSEKFGQGLRVLRGGSFSGVGHYPSEITKLVVSHYARASYRLYYDPRGRLSDAGFRCIRLVG